VVEDEDTPLLEFGKNKGETMEQPTFLCILLWRFCIFKAFWISLLSVDVSFVGLTLGRNMAFLGDSEMGGVYAGRLTG